MAEEKLTTLAKRLRPFLSGQIGAMAASGAFMNEGPGIDLVGNTIGLGGDTILLYNSDGTPVEEWPATEAGLVQALAAAASGNVVELPAGTITLTAGITIPSVIHVHGISREKSIITYAPTITGGGNNIGIDNKLGGIIENFTYNYNPTITNDGGNDTNCYGIYNGTYPATPGNIRNLAVNVTPVNGASNTGYQYIYGTYSEGGRFESVITRGNYTSATSDLAFYGHYDLYPTELWSCDIEAISDAGEAFGAVADNASVYWYYSKFNGSKYDIDSIGTSTYYLYKCQFSLLGAGLYRYLPGDRKIIRIVYAGTTTLNDTYDIVLCDASSGAITINLPAGTGRTGLQYTIKKIDSSANTVTVDGYSSETIDGATTQVINYQWTSITIACLGGGGSGWYIV